MNQLSNPICSVLILNWNGIKETVLAVDSIIKSEPKVSFEIIIIDQGSESGNIIKLKELNKNSLIKVFFLDKNLGFAGGVNYAITKANGQFYVSVNNDVKVNKGWLDHLFDSINSESSIGAACSKIIEDGLDVVGNSKYLHHIHGASMIISKNAWEIVGSFDAKNFHPAYGEELDWSYRARKIGFKLVKSNKSIVYHIGGVTSDACLTEKVALKYRIYHRILFRFLHYKYSDWISLEMAKEINTLIKNRHIWLFTRGHIHYLFKMKYIIKERKIRSKKNKIAKKLFLTMNDC